MSQQVDVQQKAQWQHLHDRITETLSLFGKKNAFGRADYWLVDENWGDYRQKLEVQNFALLQPDIVKALQALLVGYHDWEIMFRVAPQGKDDWPAMGLIIHDDEIIDDLRRELLPEDFRHVSYEGAKPWKKAIHNDAYLFRRARK